MKERDGNDDREDGRDAVGNRWGSPAGRSDMGMMTGWTERKPWEIAWESSGGKERYGNDDRVDGRETVGKSLGRAPVGRSDA